MEMETTLITTQALAAKFAHATERKDLDILRTLLSDAGEFQIQDNDFRNHYC